eukprot:Platyproteum_vivax@DN6743_c0_g1_i2.p1
MATSAAPGATAEYAFALTTTATMIAAGNLLHVKNPDLTFTRCALKDLTAAASVACSANEAVLTMKVAGTHTIAFTLTNVVNKATVTTGPTIMSYEVKTAGGAIVHAGAGMGPQILLMVSGNPTTNNRVAAATADYTFVLTVPANSVSAASEVVITNGAVNFDGCTVVTGGTNIATGCTKGTPNSEGVVTIPVTTGATLNFKLRVKNHTAAHTTSSFAYLIRTVAGTPKTHTHSGVGTGTPIVLQGVITATSIMPMSRAKGAKTVWRFTWTACDDNSSGYTKPCVAIRNGAQFKLTRKSAATAFVIETTLTNPSAQTATIDFTASITDNGITHSTT